jgi:hypothetical protein
MSDVRCCQYLGLRLLLAVPGRNITFVCRFTDYLKYVLKTFLQHNQVGRRPLPESRVLIITTLLNWTLLDRFHQDYSSTHYFSEIKFNSIQIFHVSVTI